MRNPRRRGVPSSDDFRATNRIMNELKGRMPSDHRFRINRFLLDTPALANIYMRARVNLRYQRVKNNSDIVIEGFPRSATSFALYAFRHANPGSVIHGHTHSAQNVIAAARLQVPTLLLVRHPDDVVASFVQLRSTRFETVFRGYSSFYEKLLPVVDQLVIGRFDAVTTNFGSVCMQINQKYARDFAVPQETSDAQTAIANAIDDAALRRGRGVVKESTVARPSVHRRSTEEMMSEIAESARRARELAISVFNEVTALK